MQLSITGGKETIKATKTEIKKLRDAADVLGTYHRLDSDHEDVKEARETIVNLVAELEAPTAPAEKPA